MALKYYFEFTSSNVKSKTEIEKISHRVEIYNDAYVGDALRVFGKCSMKKASTKDTLEPIRGGGLQVELEADVNLTFEDLYSENERTFYVKYIRDSVTEFLGWLSPEGLYQSFVEDKWIINLDCTDGLGFLNNLSYVDNTTKQLFTGKQTQLEIIANCLKRTGIEMDIYVRKSSILYEDQTIGTDTLSQVNANSFRYVKDDGITTMTCEEVLKTVLEPYGMIITQRDGKWFIVKPNDLYTNANFTFFLYDSDGIALTPSTEIINLAVTIGSQINDFYPYHIGAQQQLSIAQSIGAYRINYKYGLVKSFFSNIYLESVTSPPPLLYVDDWTINDATYLGFPTDNIGLLLEPRDFGSPDPISLIMTSDVIAFDEGDSLRFSVKHQRIGTDVYKSLTSVNFKVVLTDGSSAYYLNNDAEWVIVNTLINRDTSINEKQDVFITQQMPIAGDVYIEIYRPYKYTTQGSLPTVFLTECTFTPVNEELEDVKGEIHTFQITDKPSTKIEDVKEVFNGDSASDIYSGTLYESDTTTPTELWYRNEAGTVYFKPLLQLMGEERMKMYAKPLRVFTGEVMGYIKYLSVISINGLDGLFMPTEEYSYNAKENTTKFKLKQILNENIIDAENSGITYNSFLDTGQVTEPTIK